MKSLRVLGLTAIFGLMATGISLAGELKIAYIQLSKVFDSYKKTVDFDATLKNEGESFQKQRDTMVQKIQDAQNRLDLMKDSEKSALEADIDKQKNAVIAFDNEKRRELAKRRDDKVREILGEVQSAAGNVAKKQGYTYVMNDRAMIWSDAQFDITDQVLKALNDSYRR